MPYERTLIRQLSKATIPLDDIDLPEKMYDMTYGESNAGKQYIGADFPYIVINKFRFELIEIYSLEIDCTDFLPKISVEIKLATNSFMAGRMPIDGDIMSVYIRSYNDTYKPIHNDYLITEIVAINEADDVAPRLHIKGVLNLKDIWIKRNTAIKGTSVDVIRKIADELQLGYATNFTEKTNDEMIWICPWMNYKDFLQHISERAWLNEESFFRIFIDIYYNINFIEVNRQLDNTKEFDESLAILTDDLFREYIPEFQGNKLPSVKNDLILSNHLAVEGFNVYVDQYELDNRSSKISYENGYSRKVYYYDHTLKTIEEINSIDANPLATHGTEDKKIRLRGKINEDYHLKHIERSWTGAQYSNPIGNVHQKYNLSKEQNDVNNIELEKLKMFSHLKWWNPALLRGARVPLIIFLFGEIGKLAPYMNSDEFNLVNDSNTQNPTSGASFTVDRFKSGFYYVEGFKISYSPLTSKIDQHLVLTRREWGVPQDKDVF